MISRSLLCLLGVFFAMPIAVLTALALSLPITISGFGYLLACIVAVVGMIITPWHGKPSFMLISLGVLAIGLIAGARLMLTGRDPTSRLRVITLPQGKTTRWVNAIIDEQDSLIFGEAIFHRIGGDSAREHEQLTEALHRAYSEMRATHGVVASPFLSTYLNLQSPTAFDAVIIDPETMRHPERAVIFLHGYMGNVTAQCWEIAQAVGVFGALTVCPSTDWTGQWWSARGESILQATFRYLREQGIERFYVGGFSNGGFGISRMAVQLRQENGLRGLFFINGIANGPDIKETGLPVLIIQGTQDERVPAELVRPTATAIGEQATYVELEGDHFMIMKQPSPVQDALAAWLENQETIR